MGLFTSLCPDCLREIDWFLKTPQDYVCPCGRAVTPKEIEYSWQQQVGDNPTTWAWLNTLFLDELEGMLAEGQRTGRAVRSPRPGDDRCLIQGHFGLLKSAIREKQGQG